LSDLFQVDLLRERREQLGLPEPKAVNSQELLRKGILAGGAAVGLVLGLLGWFGFRLWSTRSAADALEPVSQQYVGLEQAVQGSRGRLKGIEQSNEGLVNEILSLPSSSALLTLMGRLTPPGVQLTDLSEKEGALVLKGEAADPQAFSRVESLMLQMAASPLFDKESIQLLKAERGKGEASQAAAPQAAAPAPQQPAAPAAPAPAPAPPLTPAPIASSVQFELNASFAKTAPKQLVKEFLALGARGKALRVAQLQQEGLMP
jgi:Tfp pilus assembly protein PilN